MSLDGTTEKPHFDRTAYRVNRIYATLAADGLTANLMLTPEEQEFMCEAHPDALAPVPNAWGRQGSTTATLAALDKAQLRAALNMAWRHAVPKKKPRSL
jgi:hypothetical protein